MRCKASQLETQATQVLDPEPTGPGSVQVDQRRLDAILQPHFCRRPQHGANARQIVSALERPPGTSQCGGRVAPEAHPYRSEAPVGLEPKAQAPVGAAIRVLAVWDRRQRQALSHVVHGHAGLEPSQCKARRQHASHGNGARRNRVQHGAKPGVSGEVRCNARPGMPVATA